MDQNHTDLPETVVSDLESLAGTIRELLDGLYNGGSRPFTPEDLRLMRMAAYNRISEEFYTAAMQFVMLGNRTTIEIK